MFKADDPATVRAAVRNRLKDEMLRVVMAALDAGTPARLTKSGIQFAGDGGTVGTHWTSSDWRTSRNLEAELRRIGVDLPRVHKVGAGGGSRSGTAKKRVDRFKPLPAPYEMPRQQTVTYRHVIEPEAEPVIEERRMRREPVARARALTARKVHPRVAPFWPRLSDDLREANPDLVVAALAAADGDPRRLTVEPDGSLLVWNRPAW